MFELRLVVSGDWRAWRAVRLEALREAPHAFGATLAEWQGDGDTEERWRARLEAVPFNVIAFDEDGDAGQVSGIPPDDQGQAELISMWVAPRARGRGVGEALIDAIIRWAEEQSATSLLLDVRRDNNAAIALYRRLGFMDHSPPPRVDDDPLEQAMLLSLPR